MMSMAVVSQKFPYSDIDINCGKSGNLRCEQLLEEHRSLQQAYEDYRVEMQTLIARKDDHITRLQDRVDSLESRLADVTVLKQTDLAQSELNELKFKSTSQHLNDINFGGEHGSHNVDHSVGVLMGENTDLETKLSLTISSHFAEIVRLKSHHATEIESLKQTLAEVQTRVSSEQFSNKPLRDLEVNTAKCIDDMCHFRNLAEELQNTIDGLNSELANQKASFERQLSKMADLVRSRQAEVDSETLLLKARLADAQNLIWSLKNVDPMEISEIKDVQSELHITDLANEVEDLHQVLDDQHRDLTVMFEQLRERESQHFELLSKVTKLEQANARQLKIIENLRDEIDKQKEKYQEASRAKDELLLRNASLSHEIENARRESKQEHEEIASQLATMVDQIDSYRDQIRRFEQAHDSSDVIAGLRATLADVEEALRIKTETVSELRKLIRQNVSSQSGFSLPVFGSQASQSSLN